MIPSTMTYTLTQLKSLPAPTVKRLLREAGHTQRSVAARRQVASSLVSRVVSKKVASKPVWEDIVWALNHPRRVEEEGAA